MIVMKSPEKINITQEEISGLELRSEQVQEIIGATPSVILRLGSASLLILVISILALSCYIKYPVIIQGKFSIFSSNPPVYMKAVRNACIEKLFFGDGDTIAEGQIITVFESTASFNDVLALGELLGDPLSISSPELMDHNLKLGELQESYALWLKKVREYNDHISGDFHSRELENTSLRKKFYQKYLDELAETKGLKKEGEEFIKAQHTIDSFLSGDGMIKSPELYKTERGLPQRYPSENDILLRIIDIELEINSLERLNIEQEKTYHTKTAELLSDIDESHKVLLGAIELWKKQNLLISPLSGIISYSDIRSERQYVNIGQDVCVVVPSDRRSIIGKLFVPVQNAGKVKAGQQVNLKLANYPFREYGMLITRLSRISLVPDSVYIATIELPDTLLTNYGIQIPFSQNLQGTFEIITENKTLMERILLAF